MLKLFLRWACNIQVDFLRNLKFREEKQFKKILTPFAEIKTTSIVNEHFTLYF